MSIESTTYTVAALQLFFFSLDNTENFWNHFQTLQTIGYHHILFNYVQIIILWYACLYFLVLQKFLRKYQLSVCSFVFFSL